MKHPKSGQVRRTFRAMKVLQSGRIRIRKSLKGDLWEVRHADKYNNLFLTPDELHDLSEVLKRWRRQQHGGMKNWL